MDCVDDFFAGTAEKLIVEGMSTFLVAFDF